MTLALLPIVLKDTVKIWSPILCVRRVLFSWPLRLLKWFCFCCDVRAEGVRKALGVLHQLVRLTDVRKAKPEYNPVTIYETAITVLEVPKDFNAEWDGQRLRITAGQCGREDTPGIDAVRSAGSPEELAQILANTLPQDLTGSLTLFTAADHKFVQVRSATVHRLCGDYSSRTVPAAKRKSRFNKLIFLKLCFWFTTSVKCHSKTTQLWHAIDCVWYAVSSIEFNH